MSRVSKLAILMVCAATFARADAFTNYTLYGWSSPAWPSDTTNALRQQYVRPPTINYVIGSTTVVVVASVTNRHYGYLRVSGLYDADWVGLGQAVATSNSVDPKIWLDQQDLRAYELAHRLYWTVYYANGPLGDNGTLCPARDDSEDVDCRLWPAWFYRYDHDNLVCAKGIITKVCASYVDVRQLTNAVLSGIDPEAASYWGPWSGRLTGSPPYWTPGELAAAVGAPTNYFSWTPWRSLSGIGYAFQRETTHTWTIATGYTGLVSVTNMDVWGDAHVHTGTNGQLFGAVITNANIEPGYTSLDYGYKRIERMVSLLDQPWRLVTPEGYTNKTHAHYDWSSIEDVTAWIGTTTNIDADWGLAKMHSEEQWREETNSSAAAWNIYTSGDLVGGYYSVDARSSVRRASMYESVENCDTDPSWHAPGGRRWALYAKADPPLAGGSADGDFYGWTYFQTNGVYLALRSAEDAGTYALPIQTAFGFETFPAPPWTDEPTLFEPGTARGFVCNLAAAYYILRPNWVYGAVIDLPAMTTSSTSTTTSTSTTSTTTTSTSSTTATPP